MVWRERMNPLGLDPARFLVADDETSQNALLAIGQRRPLGDGADWEIASLVTAPAARGAGVGGALLAALVAAVPPGSRVWLTTIEPRVPFYQRHGFEAVRATAPGVPLALAAEAAVGSVVARLVAKTGIVVMKKHV